MVNVILVTWGSNGDVLPFIGIGSELKKRGHSVTLIANPFFESQAMDANLSFAPVGAREEYAKLMTTPELWDWKQTMKAWFKHMAPTWASSMKLHYEMILSMHQPGQTVLIGNVLAPAARIAQEKFDIPMATVCVCPASLPSSPNLRHPARPLPIWAKWVGTNGKRLFWRYLGYRSRIEEKYFGVESMATLLNLPVNQFRSTLQLSPIREPYGKWLFSPQRIIGTWPDWFDPPQPYWPKQVELTGFPIVTHIRSDVKKDIVCARKEEGYTPIVFTTGSVACSQNDFFACAAKTCEILDYPGLLVTPDANQIPSKLPPNVAYVDYAHFDELFSNSAAVVHHGGIGTTAYALLAGIPQVAIPMASDQFTTAERIEQLGVGKMITGKHNPVRLARSLRLLLESSYVADRCKYWQSRVDPATGLSQAADSVETLSSNL